MDFLALENGRHLHQIRVGRVGAASDSHLVYLYLADILHAVYIVRAVWLGRQRSQLVQIYDQLLVVYRVRICRERSEVSFSALGLQIFPRVLIAREDRCRRSQLRSHVGDSRSVGNGKALHAFARVLYDLAYAALYSKLLQHVEDNILR